MESGIIDKFFVSLGLDPSDYIKGSKQFNAAQKALKDSADKVGASMVDSGKKMDGAGKAAEKNAAGSKKANAAIVEVQKSTIKLSADLLKLVDAFGKMGTAAERNLKKTTNASNDLKSAITAVAIEAFTMFATFESARAVKNFVTDMIDANAALGRLAFNLGVVPQRLAAWQMAAERVGGSPEQTAQSFERISKSIYDFRNNAKNLPIEFYRLQQYAAGGRINLNGSAESAMTSMAGALQRMAKVDPSKAHFTAQALGIDDYTAQLMIKYGDGLKAYIDQLERLAPQSGAIKASQNLIDSFANLKQTAMSLVNSVAPQLLGAIDAILKKVVAWAEANREWLATGLVNAVQALADFVTKTDWSKIGESMANGLKDVLQIAHDLAAILREIHGLTETDEERAAKRAAAAEATSRSNMSRFRQSEIAFANNSAQDAALAGSRAGTTDRADITSDEDFKAQVDRWRANEARGAGASGNRATGGDFIAGRRYRVGERGPEDIVMGGSGSVVPGGFNSRGIKVEGRDVSRGNPVPVVFSDGLGGNSNGGLWQWLFGSGTASAASTSDSSDGGGIVGKVKQLAQRTGKALGLTGGGKVAFGSNAGGAAPKNTGDAMRVAMDQLRKEGVPEANLRAAAAILVGQARAESGLNPKQVHDHGTGYGIYGARLERRDRMFRWLAQNGYSKDSLEGQMRYMAHEAMTSSAFAETKRILMGATADNIGRNTARVTKNFENPLVVNDRSGLVTSSYAAGPKERATAPSGNIWAGRPGRPHTHSLDHVTSLSTMTNTHQVTNSQTSNAMHVGNIAVNAPRATNARDIADGITSALSRSTLAMLANSGQA